MSLNKIYHLTLKESAILILIFIFFAETPCGQLPVLCYNGTEIGQSMTIARFLAKEFGLAGKNNLEVARLVPNFCFLNS